MFDREKIRNVLNNRYNICIPTEGQAHTRQPIINFPCDLNFFGMSMFINFIQRYQLNKKVVGCQRTDFLKNKDNQILIKKRSKMNFLQTKKKNITFAIPDASLKFKGKIKSIPIMSIVPKGESYLII